MSSSKVFCYCLILLIGVGTYTPNGFAWPWGKKDQKTRPAAAAPMSEGLDKTRSNESQADRNLMPSPDSEAEESIPESSAPRTSGASSYSGASTLPALPVKLPAPVDVYRPRTDVESSPKAVDLVHQVGSSNRIIQDTQIVEIQRELNEIMRLNESLKSKYLTQSQEIQRITEQARIHQQILNQLEATSPPPASVPAVPASAQDELSREKVRLIREEAEKNRNYLNQLENQSAAEQHAAVR